MLENKTSLIIAHKPLFLLRLITGTNRELDSSQCLLPLIEACIKEAWLLLDYIQSKSSIYDFIEQYYKTSSILVFPIKVTQLEHWLLHFCWTCS